MKTPAPTECRINLLHLVLVSMVLTVSFVLNGQEQFNYMPTDYSIIAPPPEVAALIEHNEIAVNYNSGQPNISFTLFSVSSGALEIPVTLSYQSGGIRVSQKAGNAGLGWSVLANAAIGRRVVGLPDEMNANASFPKIIGLIEQQQRYSDEAKSDYNFRRFLMDMTTECDHTNPRKILETYGDYAYYNRYTYGYTDVANDVATLSGLGLSATFAYNNKRLIMSSESPITIRQSTPYEDAFTVIDASMNEYTFGEMEVSRSIHSHGNPIFPQTEDTIMQVSAWYLTTMKNLIGDSISLEYAKGKERWWGSASTSKSYSQNPQLKYYVKDWSASGSATFSHPSLLSVIRGRGVKAEFFYIEKTDEDRNTNFMIDRIVYSYTGAENSEIEFKFNYDNESFLKSIDRNGERIYSFEYYTDAGLSDGGIDFGGYYNGQGAPNGGIPPCEFRFADSGDDRSVHTDYAITRSLKSITYPTGGKDVLLWESHSVSSINGEPLTTNPNTTTEMHVAYTDTLCGLNIEGKRKTTIDNFRVSSTGKYYIKLNNYLQFDPTILLNSDYYSSHIGENSVAGANYPCVVFMDKNNNNHEVLTYYIDFSTLQSSTAEQGYLIPVPLAEGLYKIELRNPTAINLQGFSLEEMFKNSENGGLVFIEVQTSAANNQQEGTALWPGLRIKQIFSDFNDGTPGIRKQYFYSNDMTPGKTSGNAMCTPLYTHDYTLVMMGLPPAVPDMTGLNFDTYSQVFVTTPEGQMSSSYRSSAVEYSDVGVMYSLEDPYEPTDLHRDAEWFHYTSADINQNRDILLKYLYQHSQPASAKVMTSRAFRRGLLTRHATAAQSGMTPATVYEYDIYESADVDTLTTDAYMVTNYSNWSRGDLQGGVKHLYSIGKYCFIPYNKKLRSTVYIDNGFRTSNTIDYFYDSYTDKLDRDLVKSKTDTLADGRVKTTYYTYIKKNGVYMPLKECEFVVEDGIITTGQMCVYDEAFRLKGKNLLGVRQKIFTESLINGKQATDQLKSYFNNIGYEYKYDEGRLVEIDYNRRPLVSYLWGYENMYPVIEASGIRYEALKSVGGNTPLANLEIIRNSFPGRNIKCVKWSPLIGPVEISESNDIVTRYTYDNQGRLTTVRDTNNALIERYYYVY